MSSSFAAKARLREEQDILDRIENVKRLIQMETTLLTTEGAHMYCSYRLTSNDGTAFGGRLLDEVREDIQLQLLSIVALCRGSHADVNEPTAMLEWSRSEDFDFCAEDEFHDAWDKCLVWNA